MTLPAAVLFDLGGVLLPFDEARRVRRVAEALAIDEAAAQAALRADLIARLDLGEADEADFAVVFSQAAGRTVDADEARELILSVFVAPNAALWTLAQTLKARVPVGGFSDNPAFVGRLFPAGAILEPMCWSSELRATKPSEAAFAAVEARLGVAPEAILFIDDAPANVDGAKARGWDAVLYRDNGTLLADLAARGLP